MEVLDKRHQRYIKFLSLNKSDFFLCSGDIYTKTDSSRALRLSDAQEMVFISDFLVEKVNVEIHLVEAL